ncbi:hypothetical protein D1872_341520 [compost metagenome]
MVLLVPSLIPAILTDLPIRPFSGMAGGAFQGNGESLPSPAVFAPVYQLNGAPPNCRQFGSVTLPPVHPRGTATW